MKKLTRSRGFTLIEILVVIAIIAVLTAVVLMAVMEARKSARDKARISDLEQIKAALHIYAVNYKTYLVRSPAGSTSAADNTGSGGQGWFASPYSGLTVAQGLVNAGLLTTLLHDPMVPHGSSSANGHRQYMVYFFNPGGATGGACVFAQLERPNDQHTAAIDAAPVGALLSTIKNSYSMNYATCTPR